jgi:hypothetical protein
VTARFPASHWASAKVRLHPERAASEVLVVFPDSRDGRDCPFQRTRLPDVVTMMTGSAGGAPAGSP